MGARVARWGRDLPATDGTAGLLHAGPFSDTERGAKNIPFSPLGKGAWGLGGPAGQLEGDMVELRRWRGVQQQTQTRAGRVKLQQM